MARTTRSTALQAVFEDWVKSRPGQGPRAGNGTLSETSAQLYRDMWAVFTQFLLSHPLPRTPASLLPDATGLSRLRKQDLLAFLETGQLLAPSTDGWSQRYTWRMLHLIDRVLRFHSLRTAERAGPNTLASDLLRGSAFRFANASTLDQAPEVLRNDEVQRLRCHLETVVTAADRDPRGAGWREVRDATMVALMLGSGLAPGDVLGLQATGLALPSERHPQGRVHVRADGLSPAHEVPLASWAVPAVRCWLHMRTTRAVTSAEAFPGTLNGTSMSRMSLHRRVVQVMAAAGIEGGVPFRLRHTFAVMQLAAGQAPALVGQWMGLVESKAIQRYVESVKGLVQASPEATHSQAPDDGENI